MRIYQSNSREDAVEKIGGDGVERAVTLDDTQKGEVLEEDEGEVFKSHTGQAEFRALGWYATLSPHLSVRISTMY